MPSHDVEEFLLTYDGGEIIEKIKNLLTAAQFIIDAEKRTLEKTFSKILRRLSRLSSLNHLRLELLLPQLPPSPKKLRKPTSTSQTLES
jgi:hypothetical protein